MTDGKPGRAEWGLFALLLALAVALRLYRLGAEGLWLDEVLSIGQAPSSRRSALAGFWSLEGYGRPFSQLPLTAALRFGESEFITRLPYAIFSMLEVAVIYVVARRLAGWRTALVAMAFVAVSPLHVWYAQEVRWYALWSLVSTLSFLALLEARRGERVLPWLGYAVATAVNFYTFVLSIFVAAVQVLATWLYALAGGGRRQIVRQLATLVVASLIALPVFAIALGYNPTQVVVGTPRSRSLAELPYVFFTYVVGFSLGPTVGELHRNRDLGWIFSTFPLALALAAVVGALLLRGLWRVREDTNAATLLVPWAIGLPVLVFAVSMVTGQTFNVRYAFPGLAGFVILLAIGVHSFAGTAARSTAVIVVLAVFTTSLASYYWDARYDKENVREAVALIERSDHATAPVGFVGQGDVVAEYYGPDLDLRSPLDCATSPEAAEAYPPETLDGEPVAWLMVSRDWTDDVNGCLEALRRTHRAALHEVFIGVDLWRFERLEVPAAPD